MSTPEWNAVVMKPCDRPEDSLGNASMASALPWDCVIDRQPETEQRMAAIHVTDPAEDQRQADLGNLIGDHRPGDADDGRFQTGRYRREGNGKDPARRAGEKIAERRIGEQQPVDVRVHADNRWSREPRE